MGRSQRQQRVSEEKAKFSWHRSPFCVASLGGLLLWAAFPPIGVSWLGWLAPLPWLWLARERQLAGRSFWLQLWLSGTLSWVVLLEGIRRAHPANNLGLLALSLYLGVYCPAFVAAVRAAVYRANVPFLIAAPIVWTGFEWLRGTLFTGFSMGLLAHTQSELTQLIQIADLFGAYGVSFLMVLVAACLLPILPQPGKQRQFAPAVFALVLLAATITYGAVRLHEPVSANDGPHLKVALLQGTRDKIFEINPELNYSTWIQYSRLAQQARDEQPDVDLIVWPEATFTSMSPEVVVEEPVFPPQELNISEQRYAVGLQHGNEKFLEHAREAATAVHHTTVEGQAPHDIYQLIGAESLLFTGDSMRNFNAALLLDPRGQIVDRYYKCHAVMFGEYIPFGEILPWLYKLTPMRQGLSCGDGPRLFEVKGFHISPNICFEITVPHLLRRGYQALVQNGKAAPDVLINLTDDGWFWGSTVLDLQLACAVFRAIEVRRPVLIAANTGISASIDGSGRILVRSPKRQEDIIYADVARDTRSTLYCWWGDIPALLCLALTAIWIGKSLVKRRHDSAVQN